MPLRSRAMVPSTASRVMIRVEEYTPDRMAGLLYNPYLDKIERFKDVLDLTDKLDGMFDALAFPQANTAYRSFNVRKKTGKQEKQGPAAPAAAGQNLEAEKPGKDDVKEQKFDSVRKQDKNVFMVHVQFRQNASWQGTINWAGRGDIRFRSTLEMLKIMDNALQETLPAPEGQRFENAEPDKG